MPTLTTHVLDTSQGKPAANMKLRLLRGTEIISEHLTNSDGRCDSPLLKDEQLIAGSYTIEFSVREYFQSAKIDCPFLDRVPISFSIEEGQSYHVPLLCSPWSYSTYRGS